MKKRLEPRHPLAGFMQQSQKKKKQKPMFNLTQLNQQQPKMFSMFNIQQRKKPKKKQQQKKQIKPLLFNLMPPQKKQQTKPLLINLIPPKKKQQTKPLLFNLMPPQKKQQPMFKTLKQQNNLFVPLFKPQKKSKKANPRVPWFGDWDKDGAMNIFDCQPLNPLFQDSAGGFKSEAQRRYVMMILTRKEIDFYKTNVKRIPKSQIGDLKDIARRELKVEGRYRAIGNEDKSPTFNKAVFQAYMVAKKWDTIKKDAKELMKTEGLSEEKAMRRAYNRQHVKVRLDLANVVDKLLEKEKEKVMNEYEQKQTKKLDYGKQDQGWTKQYEELVGEEIEEEKWRTLADKEKTEKYDKYLKELRKLPPEELKKFLTPSQYRHFKYFDVVGNVLYTKEGDRTKATIGDPTFKKTIFDLEEGPKLAESKFKSPKGLIVESSSMPSWIKKQGRDKQFDKYAKENLTEHEWELYDKDPVTFLAGTDVEGTWVPKERRSSEQRMQAIRRRRAKERYPNAVPYYMPVEIDDYGKAHIPKSVVAGKYGRISGLSDSEGGAFHSAKFHVRKQIIAKARAGEYKYKSEIIEDMDRSLYAVMKIRFQPQAYELIKDGATYEELIEHMPVEKKIFQSFKDKDIHNLVAYLQKEGLWDDLPDSPY